MLSRKTKQLEGTNCSKARASEADEGVGAFTWLTIFAKGRADLRRPTESSRNIVLSYYFHGTSVLVLRGTLPGAEHILLGGIMAPNLATTQHALSREMLVNGTRQLAESVPCKNPHPEPSSFRVHHYTP
jgi:hypothetical protein